MLEVERGGLDSFVVALGLCFAACGGGNEGDDDSAGGESGESGSKASGGGAGKSSGGKGGAGGTGGGPTGGTSGSVGGAGGTLPMFAGRSGGGTGGTGGTIGGTGPTGGTGGTTGGTGGTTGDAGEAGDTSGPGAGGTTGGTGGGGVGGSAPGGRGGGAGMGGSGGASPTGASLGMPCAADADCADGLSCFQADDAGGFGPPGGSCTAACEDDPDCDDFASGAICISGGAKGLFCVLGCTIGEAEAKCNERSDVVCGIGYLLGGSDGCDSYTDCLTGQVCASDGYCADPVTGCVPWCRGDFDCDSGQFCDSASGYCVNTAPVGSDYGELCDPAASTDECAGSCFVSGTGADGMCSSYCSFNPDNTGCGWDGTGSTQSGCLFGTILTPQAQLGDLGACAALCDCNADCPAEGDYCGADLTDFISDTWGHPGYCRPLLEEEIVADTLVCGD